MALQYRNFPYLREAALSALIVLVTSAASLAADAAPVTWTQLPNAGFPARAGFASAYDPISKKVVVFGGLDANGTFFNETWTFDGSTWQKIETAVAPSARASAAMGYDSQQHKLVLFGGFQGFTVFQDTWMFDGATSSWKQAPLKHLPPSAVEAMIFTDPETGNAIMYGGKRSMFYSRDTFRWTGKHWSLLDPRRSPYPRAGGINVLDPAHKNVVVFGGLSDLWITQNTWTWNGRNWRQRHVSTQPDTLYFTSGAYDPDLSEVVAFGGGSGGVDQTTTWAWTGTQWTLLSPGGAPAAREHFGTVWYPDTHQFLIFGGFNFNTGEFFSDTWVLEQQ